VRRPLTAALVGTLLAALAGCGREPVTLPEELCGRWITDDPKYAGRYLELSNETLRFGNGDEVIEESAVVRIERSGEGADFHYDVTYTDANGDESVFSFIQQVRRGTIRIAHSPQRLWRRSREGDSCESDAKVETGTGNPER